MSLSSLDDAALKILNTFWGKNQRPDIWGRGSLLECSGLRETKSLSMPGKYPPSVGHWLNPVIIGAIFPKWALCFANVTNIV